MHEEHRLFAQRPTEVTKTAKLSTAAPTGTVAVEIWGTRIRTYIHQAGFALHS